MDLALLFSGCAGVKMLLQLLAADCWLLLRGEEKAGERQQQAGEICFTGSFTHSNFE